MPEPPEPQRLRDVINDLEAGTDALPRGITHHPDVLRRYFYDRIFQGEWDGQIGSPEGDNVTKHAGRFISLTTLRDQVLKDIEDLIAFMTVPVNESTRSATFFRTPEAKTASEEQASAGLPVTKEPFVPEYMAGTNPRGYRYFVREEEHSSPRINATKERKGQHLSEKSTTEIPASGNVSAKTQSRDPSKSAYQPSSEKFTAMENRQPFLDKLRVIESRDNNRPEADSLSVEVSQHNAKGVSAEHTTSEASSSMKQPIDSLHHSTSQHGSPSQGNHSSSQATLAPPNQETMDGPSLAELLQRPMEVEGEKATRDATIPSYLRRGNQTLGHQLPTQNQQLPFGGLPTGIYPQAADQDPWTALPVLQPGYGYPQQSSGLHRPHCMIPQPLQYAPQPMQYGYAQHLDSYPSLDKGPPPPYTGLTDHPPVGMSRYLPLGQQGVTARSDFGPPPPPGPYANVAVRAPAPNGIAAMVYRNDPALHYHGLPQVRGTPVPSLSQDRVSSSISLQNHHEWRNRFGLVPAIKPDIPVMAYRPGSDDMRPHPGNGPSMALQNLTRHPVPTFEEARDSKNLPFTEIAKEVKPPEWGVLKIANVSTQVKDEDWPKPKSKTVSRL